MNPDAIYRQLAVELKSIEDQIRELKQRQFTGSDTVQTYVNKAPGEWDIDWTLDPFIHYSAMRDISVLFLSDTQVAPVNSLRYIILIDNKELFTVASFDDHPQDVSVNAYVHDSFLVYANLQPTPRLDGWYFNVTGYRAGMNIKVKFIVDSTDTGTVTWRDI